MPVDVIYTEGNENGKIGFPRTSKTKKRYRTSRKKSGNGNKVEEKLGILSYKVGAYARVCEARNVYPRVYKDARFKMLYCRTVRSYLKWGVFFVCYIRS